MCTVVKWVSHLLKCDAKLLIEALLIDERIIMEESVEVPMNMEKVSNALLAACPSLLWVMRRWLTLSFTCAQAKYTRDTLAKELYGRNFGWIVNRLSTDMEAKVDGPIIHLLDIFGFEHYQTNAFEQFCINYANERLQGEFNDHIFKREKALYVSEGIDAPDFKYEDNREVLNMIEKAPNGIFSVLDKTSHLPSGTDESFVQSVHANHRTSKVRGV